VTPYWRPRTRGDCAEVERPCPFVSCRYNLYLDIYNDRGDIKLNFPDIDVTEMTESCALDVADRLGSTLETVGEYLNVTREAVRLTELKALKTLHSQPTTRRLAEHIDMLPSALGMRLRQLTADDFEEQEGECDADEGDDWSAV
jgi:hypothetical protein